MSHQKTQLMSVKIAVIERKKICKICKLKSEIKQNKKPARASRVLRRLTTQTSLNWPRMEGSIAVLNLDPHS